MSKKLTIFIIFVITIISFATVCSATDINMNLIPNEVDNSSTTGNEELTGNETLDTTTNEVATDDIGGVAAPSGVSSIAQENMSFSNILNILIITVGVVLILLAIAILIRLKS